MAFVEYQDVRYAAQAMATLQGSFLLSSDRGAIRIEYAKSKMAEVGFTNLWIEVGSTLCYDRPPQRSRGAALCEIGEVSYEISASSKPPAFVCAVRDLGRARAMVPRKILARARILARAFLAHFAHVERASMKVFVTIKRGACVPSYTQGPRLCAQVLNTSVYYGLAQDFCTYTRFWVVCPKVEPPPRKCDQRQIRRAVLLSIFYINFYF